MNGRTREVGTTTWEKWGLLKYYLQELLSKTKEPVSKAIVELIHKEFQRLDHLS